MLIIFSLLIISAFVGSSFLWFVYRRQSRYATLLFDMINFYLILIIFALLTSLISTIFLFITENNDIFLFLTPIIIVWYFYQLYYFYRWNRAYSIQNYISFLEKIKLRPDFEIINWKDWLKNPTRNPDKVKILLRHDVDIIFDRFIKMMEIEEKLGIPSCYFIRDNAERYKFEKAIPYIKKMESSNLFEPGLHYQSITNASGNIEKGKELFKKEVDAYRKYYPLVFVAAHGDKYDNKRLFYEKLVDFDQIGVYSAYSIGHDHYISDSGGLHHYDNFYGKRIFISDMLESLFDVPKNSIVQILIHPDWWH